MKYAEKYLEGLQVVMHAVTGYYPSGLPYAITAGEAETDRLHTGKQFIDHNGAGLHDNGARMLDGILCEYISVDPLSDKYPSMSHYVHCADNPLAYIDPDGREIVAVYDGISYTYRKEGDEYAFYDRDGNSYMGDDPFTNKSKQSNNNRSPLYMATCCNSPNLHRLFVYICEKIGLGF